MGAAEAGEVATATRGGAVEAVQGGANGRVSEGDGVVSGKRRPETRCESQTERYAPPCTLACAPGTAVKRMLA